MRPSRREPRSPTTPRVEGSGRTVLACPAPSRKHSTNQPGTRARSCRADFVGSVAWPWCSLGMPRCPPSPVPRAARPARQQEGRTMTQAAVSFAGNLTDDPQVRYTDSRIARAMFRWPSLVGGNRSRRSSPWSSGVTRPSMRPSRCRRAAGSWSWAGSSSGPGRLRMAAPDRPWRSWPRSWDRGCGGRRRRRPGRPGVPASSQGRITRLGGGQLPLVGRYLAPDGA